MKLFLSIIIPTLMLYSDFTLKYKMDGNVIEIIEYKDEKNVKLSFEEIGDENNSKKTGEYLINGKRYSVVMENNKLSYIDLDAMENQSQESEVDSNTSDSNCTTQIKQNYFTILKKGKPKEIAGIKGEVWDVSSFEEGEEYNESIVVSSNTELLDAMKKSVRILALFGEDPYGRDVGSEIESMLIVADGYVLLYAEGLEFVSLTHDRLPPETTMLPKEAIEIKNYELNQSSEDMEQQLNDATELLSKDENINQQ